MNIINPLIVVILTTITLIGTTTSPTYAQTPTISDLPMTTINETNSTFDVSNKTLPAENATDVVPIVPM